jgi:hypothetical protein
MQPIVDLAPGAEDNALALRFATIIRENLRRHPHKIQPFRGLRGSVQMVPFDTGDAVTLRFDLGRLTIHDGSIGIPSVTFGGPSDALARLDELPMNRWLKIPLPAPSDTRGRDAITDLGRLLVRGELKVYGAVSHPRMVARLLTVLSSKM